VKEKRREREGKWEGKRGVKDNKIKGKINAIVQINIIHKTN